MKNLLKYEFRKTLLTKLVILGITVVAQLIYLAGIWGKDREGTVVAGMLLLFFTATFGILFIGLQSVITLHRDMNTKQSYMLFMTTNSCYKILGAKMLENFLSMLLGGAFFFGLGVLDISILIRRYGQVDSLYEAFQSILRTFGWDFKLDAGYLASICFSLLSGWFATITAAFLADVVSSALLNGKKFNYLVSFVLFLALSYLMGKVGNAVAGDVLTRTEEVVELTMPNAMQSYGTVSTVTTSPGYFLRSGAVSLAFSALFYVCTAEIMQRKLSV